MTRSRKKSPFFGISTSVSEKADKAAEALPEERHPREDAQVIEEAA